MTSTQFAELAQLCPDHNHVGDHLLSMARSLSASEHPTTGSECHLNFNFSSTVILFLYGLICMSLCVCGLFFLHVQSTYNMFLWIRKKV